MRGGRYYGKVTIQSTYNAYLVYKERSTRHLKVTELRDKYEGNFVNENNFILSSTKLLKLSSLADI